MPFGAPKSLSAIRRFFEEPRHPRQRQYEARRAYFLEGKPAKDVASQFGYSPSSFHVLCHHFLKDPDPRFFVSPRRGPQAQPKKSAARQMILQLRKQNYSAYDISRSLHERKCPLSPTAVREVLKAEGFAPLPRRLDQERPPSQGPPLRLMRLDSRTSSKRSNSG